MSQNQNETDAAAETQVLPAIPAQEQKPDQKPAQHPAQQTAQQYVHKRERTLSELFAQWTDEPEAEGGAGAGAAGGTGVAGGVADPSAAAGKAAAKNGAPTNGTATNRTAANRTAAADSPKNGTATNGASHTTASALPFSTPAPVSAPVSAEAETSVIPAIRPDDEASPPPKKGKPAASRTSTPPATSTPTTPAAAPTVPTPRSPDTDRPAGSPHLPRIHVPTAFLAPEVTPGYAPPATAEPETGSRTETSPGPEKAPGAIPASEPKPAGRRRRVPATPVDAESAAAAAATALDGERRGSGQRRAAPPAREPIPVPSEFFNTPSPATPSTATPPPATPSAAAPVISTPAASTSSAATPDTESEPETETAAAASHAAASTAAPVEAEPAETSPAEKPAKKPDGGGFNGPPRWQESVPFDETGVLMRPESLRAKAMQDETELISAIKVDDDGSEAAQSQRPGFWTGAWPRRALVALIMLVQSVLSLRNNNSPFVDESLYLYSGHLELGHMLYGTSTGIDFWSYFSGAPVLYPPLGALADQIGGIFAARLLSLLFMLGTTGLLYLITRRLFGTRAGLCAAALFSCTEATIFLGGLATYDAPALFLLALATWIVVRFADGRFPLYLLAIFPAAIAVGTKYVSLLFVPTIFVLALVVAAPYSRRWALVRPVALTLGTACVLYTAYRLAGHSAAEGISATTTSRAHGTDTISLVMKQAGQYGAVVFVVALIGAVFVIRLPRRHGHPAIAQARWQRVVLVLLLAGSALLAPVYQAHLHTAVSLQKHVGFGLFFAAPLAGYGLVRVVGPHFHRVQLGIGVLVLTFAFGMGQSLSMFHSWPNSYGAVAELVKYQKAGAHYLFADGPNVIYQLRGDRYAEPSQFTDAFSFGWWDQQGKYITGNAAYADAIQAGYFQVVTYDFSANPGVEQAIAQDLYDSPIYKLVAKIPSPTSGGPGWSYVWVRK